MTDLYADPAAALTQAIHAAVENVHNGGGPFGAVIVFPDGSSYTGVNRVTANNDPTAHAEVQAIRNACAQRGDFSLEGGILYTSCEPCPMCLGAALWSRVDKVVFAADRFDAADAGFDDAAFYALLATGEVATRTVLPNAIAPFDAWRERAARIDY
jgi:guanine deaminase